MAAQTVLVVGATGNIGVAAVKGALQAGRNVLAVVRNQNSADKLIKHVGTSKGITFVEADVASDSGIANVVTKVREGKLPAFQHLAGIAYRDTIEYLREQENSSFTMCTGSQGDLATHPLPAMTQGALFSLCLGAARENLDKSVRVNEVYLGFRVEVDEDAAQHGVVSSTEFGAVFEQLLDRSDIRSARVQVTTPEDMRVLRHARRF
ncbi:nad(p)-binding protein [Emericellopsis cladophorae]|uniref:Nad(P)-binding protein n=1 Tax=Emericellopsis cladophorae TaxID=2686198 RepID=A0A9P9XVK9_9HYPO|nr:nad(p)-binding protein [Emericellopsis cladophorae]KAI6778632.1 nad(p)-binding protein [Emericellopsis cladophorae]